MVEIKCYLKYKRCGGATEAAQMILRLRMEISAPRDHSAGSNKKRPEQ